MFQLIKDFPGQLIESLKIGEQAAFKTVFPSGISSILISGLGGSGIGGNLLAELLRDELKVPVTVNKGYFLPAFVNSTTLVILSSYSGNTEETISVAQQALARGLNPICITSGGRLKEIAAENNLDLVVIPAGFPPRACLGYSSLQLFFVLHHYGLINNEFKKLVQQSAGLLETEQAHIIEDAEFLASKLAQKVLVAYAEDKYESTVLRLKQQVNENSKMHCWYNVIPEMNHNELVGWREPNSNLAVLIFRAEDEFVRNTERILFKKDVIAKLSDNVFEISAKGANSFEKHFYLIHFGDWLSYYLAVQQGYDPSEIDVLITLKEHMKSVS